MSPPHDRPRLDPVAELQVPAGEEQSRAKLRQLADTRVLELPGWVPVTLSLHDTRRALHELSVHQIELDVQNEELRRARRDSDLLLERYQDLFDSAPVGYVVVNQAGLLLEVNHSAAALLGAPRDLLVQLAMIGFVHHDDRDVFYLYCKRLADQAAPQKCKLRLVNQDGAVFWAELESSIALGGEGEPVFWIMLSDVTARKRAAAMLRSNHEQLQALNAELVRFNQIAVGRELRMVKLKEEINAMCAAAGLAPRYPLEPEWPPV